MVFNIFLWMELHAWCRALQLQHALHDAVHAMFYMADYSVLHLHSSTVMHTYTRTIHAHYTHMYAVCTNVICRLCTLHLSVQGPVGTNGKTLIHRLFLQACRLPTWKQAKMCENMHVNTHIVTYTCPIQMDMHVCTHPQIRCLTNHIARFWTILQNPKQS